jgi:D-proline reductase (dithiol) PrdB
MNLGRFKNIVIAKVITRFPSLADRFVAAYTPWESEEIPWAPVKKDFRHSRIAVVTTAGVHHRDQKPFDMQDREGDPSYRTIDLRKPLPELMITHDYYDHSDADKDINIVFPVERLKEFEQEGLIGRVSDIHYGFMGHITGRHIPALINKIAPEVARKLQENNVDAVLLTPG